MDRIVKWIIETHQNLISIVSITATVIVGAISIAIQIKQLRYTKDIRKKIIMPHYQYSIKNIETVFTDSIPKIQEVFETLRKEGKFDSSRKVEGWPFSDLVRQMREVTGQLEEMENRYYDKK